MCRSRKQILSFLLALLLLVSLLPWQVFADSSAEGSTFLTSRCSSDYLELSVSGKKLTVTGAITCNELDEVGILLKTASGESAVRKYISAASGKRFSLSLSLSGTGDLSVNVYTKLRGETTAWSYTYGRIILQEENGVYRFSSSAVSENNNAFRREWLNPADYKGSDIPADTVALSNSIVGNVKDEYTRCFLLHRWVAENIYYDYDYYYGKSENLSYLPQDVILSHKSVCEGYGRLLTDLIRAQGIPAVSISVAALGLSTNGGSFAAENYRSADASLPTEANHACVEAFVDGRWILMDPTWDSNNKYEAGSYNADTPNGFYYFDISDEAFALDHQFFDRGTVYLHDGTVVNTAEASHVPSVWAQELVAEAIGKGLVPDEYQKYYTAPISRAAMCRLAVELIEAETGSSIDAFLAEQKKSAAEDCFADTADPNVLACKALGIVDGMGKDAAGRNLFCPTQTLTRAQAAVYAAKLAKLFGEETEGFACSFPDTESHWSAAFVGWAASAGIVSGTSGGNYSPEGKLTMEQAIIIISRTLDAVQE